MHLSKYELFVQEFALREGDEWLVECSLGLGGEAGEVQEKVKKFFRDGTDPNEAGILGELGDVLYYLTALAHHFGYDLNDVGQANMDKLYSRRERGTLKGSGDNR